MAMVADLRDNTAALRSGMHQPHLFDSESHRFFNIYMKPHFHRHDCSQRMMMVGSGNDHRINPATFFGEHFAIVVISGNP